MPLPQAAHHEAPVMPGVQPLAVAGRAAGPRVRLSQPVRQPSPGCTAGGRGPAAWVVGGLGQPAWSHRQVASDMAYATRDEPAKPGWPGRPDRPGRPSRRIGLETLRRALRLMSTPLGRAADPSAGGGADTGQSCLTGEVRRAGFGVNATRRRSRRAGRRVARRRSRPAAGCAPGLP